MSPARLGGDFRWLLSGSWVMNLSDGIALAAGPLLVASQTHDPLLVGLAATVQWVPALVFGLFAGALSDRMDRRVLVLAVNAARVLVLAVLAASIATDVVSIPVVLAALFVIATAEVFADNTAGTLPPMLVAREDLATANQRLQTGFITVNQMAGPPLGAALFALGAAVPFVSQAILVAFSMLLVSRISVRGSARNPETIGAIRHEIAEGFRFVWKNAAVRTLVVTGFFFCLTSGIGWSVLVLYATDHLELGKVGFGLITTAGAVGGLVGTTAYGWLTRRVSLGNLMRVGLLAETATHLVLAVTSTAWLALAVFFMFGAHDFIWGTTSKTIRQRVVPSALQGRVGSVNLVAVYGGLVVGSTAGGAVAGRWGLTAPFWVAFVGSAVFVVLVWRQVRHIVHTDDEDFVDVV